MTRQGRPGRPAADRGARARRVAAHRPPAAAEWHAIGTTVRVVVTRRRRLAEARDLVVEELDALDRACSRFRADSEVSRLAETGGRPTRVSRLLAEAVAVALDAARRSDGDLDPTVGAALVDLGYDRDISDLRPAPEGGSTPMARVPVGGRRVSVIRRVPGWQQVELDADRSLLTVPAGTVIDLGATAKAWAADRCAQRVAERVGGGVLVSLGGDIATAGRTTVGGWCVAIRDRPDIPNDPTSTVVTLPDGAAMATSSIGSRSWMQGRHAMHHIVDPRSLRPVEPVWRYVTVAAGRCLDANIASTVALIRGHDARGWLDDVGLPARLVSAAGAVSVRGRWESAVTAVAS